ncbi:MAG: tetratricopeptide repeat protein, partial [Candidatus Solibacter usitatus]|nr:tetratricopeptide repeat protein [Candidatus Solibacter usitatus]
MARRKAGDDCTACHMPKNPVVDAQHVVYTDHSIPRRPRDAPAETSADLVPFGGGAVSDRDAALAYAIAASRAQRREDPSRAMRMLAKVERENPDDVEVLLYLAELYRNTGQADAAAPLYERAIRLDPAQVTASVGLGAIRMERGDY